MEQHQSIKEWFTVAKKFILAILLIGFGIVWDIFVDKGRVMGDVFMIFAFAGLITLLNALFSKIIKINISYIPYFIGNIIITLAMIKAFAIINSNWNILAFAVSSIILWIFNTVLIKRKGMKKRVFQGFLLTYLNMFCIFLIVVAAALLGG